MVQSRAARMVYADFRLTSSVTPLLQQLQWPTLQERRAQAIKGLHEVPNCLYLVDISVNRLTPTISVRGYNMRFLVPFARTLIYQRSFFPDTIRI